MLSPLMFILYSEQICRKGIGDSTDEIKVNNEGVGNIRYTDNIADTLQGLQTVINRITKVSEEYGLKYMVISKSKIPHTILKIYNGAIELVPKFIYLRYTLNEEWGCSQEIKCQIEKASIVFLKTKNPILLRLF